MVCLYKQSHSSNSSRYRYSTIPSLAHSWIASLTWSLSSKYSSSWQWRGRVVLPLLRLTFPSMANNTAVGTSRRCVLSLETQNGCAHINYLFVFLKPPLQERQILLSLFQIALHVLLYYALIVWSAFLFSSDTTPLRTLLSHFLSLLLLYFILRRSVHPRFVSTIFLPSLIPRCITRK
ncbi:hypothetical protein ARMSODRAFT_1085578 [Armillaria solidipes]|uniref:Uncharacterized protein n=1 Tax=Armillaria solidipes TaxID=1076256 RepID=A0A2H3BF51_9AGAR|nr:hypothetical protein ARMSODRAFT_1085578 [Armillaria solidipes]